MRKNRKSVRLEEKSNAKDGLDKMFLISFIKLLDVNEKLEYCPIEQLCEYIEAYHQFFTSGGALISELLPQIKKLKQQATSKQSTYRENSITRRLISNTKVFGVPIKELERRDPNGIPTIVLECCQFIEEKGMELEGIFRISGDQNEVISLKNAIDSGQGLEQCKPEDPHTVAALLKLYLRELPDPLLTYTRFNSFIAAVEKEEEEKIQAKKLKEIVDSLPEASYRTLQHLLLFSTRVEAHSSTNRMTARNLATCLSPNLLYVKDRDKDPYSPKALEEASRSTRAVELLIAHAPFIFSDPPHHPIVVGSSPSELYNTLIASLSAVPTALLSPPVSPTREHRQGNISFSDDADDGSIPNLNPNLSTSPPLFMSSSVNIVGQKLVSDKAKFYSASTSKMNNGNPPRHGAIAFSHQRPAPPPRPSSPYVIPLPAEEEVISHPSQLKSSDESIENSKQLATDQNLNPEGLSTEPATATTSNEQENSSATVADSTSGEKKSRPAPPRDRPKSILRPIAKTSMLSNLDTIDDFSSFEAAYNADFSDLPPAPPSFSFPPTTLPSPATLTTTNTPGDAALTSKPTQPTPASAASPTVPTIQTATGPSLRSPTPTPTLIPASGSITTGTDERGGGGVGGILKDKSKEVSTPRLVKPPRPSVSVSFVQDKDVPLSTLASSSTPPTVPNNATTSVTLFNSVAFQSASSIYHDRNTMHAWLIIGYRGPTTIELQGAGKGSVDELVKHLQDDQVQYILLKHSLQDPATKSVTSRDIFIVWTGPAVSRLDSARKRSHLGEVRELVKPYHAELLAFSRQHFTLEIVLKRSNPLSGSHVIDAFD
eukprot:TRINITY_DN5010_c0_g2_i1.p1 TRINITY_DN5010_c0_g2~~TRINITY_DN5010_c0_g2_i1.p1  ORF type:complete len:964 (-),score=189.08 TRINITY_DN5010_c0_g2_i1:50-2533(-)